MAENSASSVTTLPVVVKKTNPLASVVMLAYNHGPYIRESIESILHQKTNFSFELIIGEDCSPDDTRAIVLECQKKHPEIIRVITSEKNVGGRENCRRCDQMCQGKYVSYCEGDDYWHDTGKLQRQIDFLETHPDYVMVHSDFRSLIVETNRMFPRTIGIREGLDDSDAFNEILSGRRLVLTLTTCFRGSVLGPVLRDCPECYSPRFLMGDTQRFLEVARLGKVKYMPEIMATRRILPESATQSKKAANVLRFALSAKDVLDHYITKYGCSPEAKKAAATRSAIHLLNCAFAAGDAATAAIALDEYRKAGAAVPLEGHLFYHGSRSALMNQLVRPALFAIQNGRKIMGHVNRILKAA